MIWLRKITRITRPLIILFQAITLLKANWMLRVSTCFSHCSRCVKHSDSASVSVARVIWTYKGNMTSTSGENWKEPSTSFNVSFKYVSVI